MYIRFETELVFRDSNCSKGIFAAMGDAKRKGTMDLREHIWYINTAGWFNCNLKTPCCFNRPVSSNIKFKAQSWFKFKYECSEHLQKSLSVKNLLQKHGISVKVKLDKKPGEIIYEDELQIVILKNDEPLVF